MIINTIEFDLSSARENQAGEISGVIVTGRHEDQSKAVTIGSDANGLFMATDSRNPGETNAVRDHLSIEISEDFAEKTAAAIGFDLEGRRLQETDSTPRIRRFMAYGRRNDS